MPSRARLDASEPPSPPFMPSTRASITSTPATGAATTENCSKKFCDDAVSMGLRGGIAVCREEDDPERGRWVALTRSSGCDFPEGPVSDRTRT